MRCVYVLLFALLSIAPAHAAPASPAFSLVIDGDPGRAGRHGLEKLTAALRARGATVEVATSLATARASSVILAGVARPGSAIAAALQPAGSSLPSTPEALTTKKLALPGKPTLVLAGADARGLM